MYIRAGITLLSSSRILEAYYHEHNHEHNHEQHRVTYPDSAVLPFSIPWHYRFV